MGERSGLQMHIATTESVSCRSKLTCLPRARGSEVNDTAKCLSERGPENFNHALFAFAFFSRRQDLELPGAISRGLLDCPCPV